MKPIIPAGTVALVILFFGILHFSESEAESETLPLPEKTVAQADRESAEAERQKEILEKQAVDQQNVHLAWQGAVENYNQERFFAFIAYVEAVEEAERQAEAARRAEEARRAEQRAAAQARASAPATAPSSGSPVPAAPTTGDVWWSLALCESNGTNANTGNGYFGFFQFLPSTWRSVGGTGLPSDHSYAEQKNRAQILQARSGWGQWPACSSKLGLR